MTVIIWKTNNVFCSGSGKLKQNKHKTSILWLLKHTSKREKKCSLRKTWLQFRRYYGEFDFLYQWLCYNYRTCLPNTDTMMQEEEHQSNKFKPLATKKTYQYISHININAFIMTARQHQMWFSSSYHLM